MLEGKNKKRIMIVITSFFIVFTVTGVHVLLFRGVNNPLLSESSNGSAPRVMGLTDNRTLTEFPSDDQEKKPIKSNITPESGGKVEDNQGIISLEFPINAVVSETFISIEKSKNSLAENFEKYKRLSDIYKIIAVDSEGKEITQFKKPFLIKIKYSQNDKSLDPLTIKLAYSFGSPIKTLSTTVNQERLEASALVDHTADFLLVAENYSIGYVYARIMALIIIILGLIFGTYKTYKKIISADYRKKQLKNPRFE